MKSAALIACNNGYGHIRRLLIISETLKYHNIKCEIYADKKKVLYLVNNLSIKNLKITDIKNNFDYYKWSKKKSKIWLKKFPSLKKYDYVVSDNILEILYLRSDTIISGTFLWHQCLEPINPQLKKESKLILDKFKPTIISTSLFLPQYLRKYKKLHKVNFYTSYKKRDLKSKKTDALISVGGSKVVFENIKKNLDLIMHANENPFEYIWVDKKILPKKYPNWVRIATFDKYMYRRISVSIIRPGMGTITDSLFFGSKIFSFYEKDNIEMKTNSKILQLYNLGVSSKSMLSAWENAIQYFQKKHNKSVFTSKIRKLKFNGSNEFYKKLILKNKR